MHRVHCYPLLSFKHFLIQNFNFETPTCQISQSINPLTSEVLLFENAVASEALSLQGQERGRKGGRQ